MRTTPTTSAGHDHAGLTSMVERNMRALLACRHAEEP